MIRHSGDAMDARDIVTVKISSEAAEYLSISEVVVQQISLAELLETILAVTGKNAERVRETLHRGVLVSGASRFRWQGWDEEHDSIRRLLENFPDSEASRAFRYEHCLRTVLVGPRCRIEIPREAGQARSWLRRRSYWDALMEVASTLQPRYIEYSHHAKADCYRVDLSEAHVSALRDAAKRLRYSALRARIAANPIEWMELHTAR